MLPQPSNHVRVAWLALQMQEDLLDALYQKLR